MNFGQWMQAHRRSLLFVIALLAIAGALTAFRLPISLFPNVAFPRAVVSLDAGDRPAEQMATLVTLPVEEALRRVPNVRDVESKTSRGSAEISLNFDWGTDMAQATLQAQSAIGEILGTLPQGTSMQVRRMDPTVFPVLAYSLTSKQQSLAALHDLAKFQMRPLLSSVEGVSRVDVTGGAQDELEVAVDPARLAAYKLSVADVSRAIGASNVLTATGRIEDHYKLYLVIANATITQIDELKNVVVQSNGAAQIRLGDIASVTQGVIPQWMRVTADGQDAVLVNIYQQPGANSVAMAKAIRARLADFQHQMPPGVHVSNWYDQSELVIASATSVRDAIMIGVVLAALTLFAFLRNWKITVIAVALVPVVMAATILLLDVFGMGFNIMTLGGMAAAVGLVIDDAIVMIEHIVRRMREGGASAFHGRVMSAALEFTRPLAGSSAATLIIFVPLAFLSGVTGHDGERTVHFVPRHLARRTDSLRPLAQATRCRGASRNALGRLDDRRLWRVDRARQRAAVARADRPGAARDRGGARVRASRQRLHAKHGRRRFRAGLLHRTGHVHRRDRPADETDRNDCRRQPERCDLFASHRRGPGWGP
jgi:multidrug efflux pump subunit AcrB